jgi:2-polyprenyl-6-methoxyphenol hydroxylase-like FAD-dependent oxidoreductase
MSRTLGREAVVIGASMAGLLAARVLSDRFEHVTILERDEVRDDAVPRKGQPHARHLHALLAEGLRLFDRYFPDLREALRAGGVVFGDMGADIRWFAFGGYRRQFPSGMIGALMSRPFLEQCVRRLVQALPNVTIRSGAHVDELVTTSDRKQVTGIRLKAAADSPAEILEADLVVDASGRGSATPRWLETLGYAKPPESIVTVNMGYATRVFRRQPGDLDGAKLLMVASSPPGPERACNVFPVEGDRWMATETGWGGDYPPADEAGFLEFARSLPAPDAYDLIRRLEPISDIIQHRLPSNLRRHYERLDRFPERYLVVGDAVSSFNPVYAQGMTSAVMQIAALDDALGAGLDGLPRRAFPRLAKMVDRPWRLAAGEDFRMKGTSGAKPPGTDLINPYVARVHRATHRDVLVYSVFLDVMNLVRPATALMQPRIVWRVLRTTA